MGDTKSSLGGRDSPNQAGKARTADSGSRNSAELGVTTELAELRARDTSWRFARPLAFVKGNLPSLWPRSSKRSTRLSGWSFRYTQWLSH